MKTLRRIRIGELRQLVKQLEARDEGHSARLVAWACDRLERVGPKRGEQNANSKLTEIQVREIRRSKLSSGQLSRKLGISTSAIRHARNGRSWQHVS